MGHIINRILCALLRLTLRSSAVASTVVTTGTIVACLLLAAPLGALEPYKTYEFHNGRWFDGNQFVRRKVYSEWGRLRFSKPRKVDEVVDLKGGFVLPPLCDAHNHNFGTAYQDEENIRRFLEAGIFYVKVPSSVPMKLGKCLHFYNKPTSIDASFGNGGITGPGGQLVQLRENLLQRGAYPGFTKETLADHAYTVVETPEEVQEKWPTILSYRPDFIKFHLVHADEHPIRRDDIKYFGQKGMNPELAPLFVELGHAHGLRVAAHALTGTDFRIAIQAGVDEITHMPGYSSPQRINAEDAALAGSNGVTVITTLNAADQFKEDASLYAAIRETQVANLRLLMENGVRIAVGSDAFHGDSRIEAEYLKGLGVFTDVEILRMWTRDCAQTTFPSRYVGELREQFEASFIVLKENPLRKWSAYEEIRYRFKDGKPLEISPTKSGQR